jgi:hypothetical protein
MKELSKADKLRAFREQNAFTQKVKSVTLSPKSKKSNKTKKQAKQKCDRSRN